MNNRNLGRFSLPRGDVNNPEILAQVFSILKIVPVRIEMLFTEDKLEYTAIGERFPEVPRGRMIPEYELIVTTQAGKYVELVEVKEKT